jgi:hypothetical protein
MRRTDWGLCVFLLHVCSFFVLERDAIDTPFPRPWCTSSFTSRLMHLFPDCMPCWICMTQGPGQELRP